jgi:hypothetical protein
VAEGPFVGLSVFLENAMTLTKAEAALRKEQRAIEAQAAWREYEAQKAAVDQNMGRLRALRLAREAAEAVAPESAPGRVKARRKRA